jgi:uncharacterized protein (TIGR03437 family)
MHTHRSRRLSSTPNYSSSAKWATMLGDTEVVIAGALVPLQSAADGQINAIIPFGLAINTTQGLVVQRGVQLAAPVSIQLAAAQPSIYPVNGPSQLQGQIYIVSPDGSLRLADATNPAAAGDTILVRCAGLGEVSPTVPVGTAAPSSPLSQTVTPVSLTIQGVPAVVASATLAPGEIGVYLIQATVPAGLTAAGDAQVVIAVAGQQSPPVNMAVR